ncbi:MAG: cysteine hydrolase [Telmatospirillum sp.]|nr:cysteine hydrolase [Telmatospirillum sp.]
MSHSSSALVLIEYQHDWLTPDGKLFHLIEDEDLRSSSLARSRNALEAARAAGVRVVHAGLRFQTGYPELGSGERWGLRRHIPAAGSFPADGPGSAFVSPFSPAPGEVVVSGRTGASAFAGSNLDSILRNNRITDLYLMGYAAHVCVESTLRQAHDLGYDTTVIVDATAAFNRMQQTYFAEQVIPHFGNAITAAAFASRLASGR